MYPHRAMGKFALVIPTLNEAENLRVLLPRLAGVLDPLGPDYELMVVDDDSHDGTDRVIAEYSLRNPRVQFLVRQGKRGLAGAVIHGWQHTDAELLGVMDADLQHPPELLPSLLEALRSHDVAIASRYVQADSMAGWNPLRRLISQVGTRITYPLMRPGIRVRDPLSGFFVLHRSGIEGVELHPFGFKILLDILVRGRIRSVAEIPYQFGTRHAGKSKASVRVGWNYLSLLGRLSLQALVRR